MFHVLRRRDENEGCEHQLFQFVLHSYPQIQSTSTHVEAVQFTDAPENQHPVVGTDAQVVCRVDGDPRPQITWRMGNEELTSGRVLGVGYGGAGVIPSTLKRIYGELNTFLGDIHELQSVRNMRYARCEFAYSNENVLFGIGHG